MFSSLLNQMAFLFGLIFIGFLLAKRKIIPENTSMVLSKLENFLFIPALILGTFIQNFTVNNLVSAGKLLLFSLAIELVVIPLALVCVRFCTKDAYIRRISLYGLCFANFAFMGNAIVSSMLEDVFFEYMIFTLVLWLIIYLWAVPFLLFERDEQATGIWSRLNVLINPMFITAVVGMVIGLTAIPVPSFVQSLVSSLGGCMSPVAMLITGMTIAKINMRTVLKIKSIYVVSILRLLAFPLLFMGLYYLAQKMGFILPRAFVVCAVVSLAMPLGLNTIVIPGAQGKDTTVASGMALISHILAIVTIPMIFVLLNAL